MPYYKFYDESGESGEEEFDENDPSSAGTFHYEHTSKQFTSETLTGAAAAAFNMLKAAGVTEMRVRYDGGNDEGFSHPDDMWINGEPKFLDDVIDFLTTAANVEAIRVAAAAPKGSRWHNVGEFYSKAEPRKVISLAIDELAEEIATQLLGSGYGTGEYELYGAVTVVLETGDMIDDPDAEKPLDQM